MLDISILYQDINSLPVRAIITYIYTANAQKRLNIPAIEVCALRPDLRNVSWDNVSGRDFPPEPP